MSDSATKLDQIDRTAAASDVVANGLFDAASPATAYGRRASTTAGLTWGYYGTRYGGESIANGTLTLTANSTNYIVADRVTGEVSLGNDSPNPWDDPENYIRLYKITTGTSTVSSYEDHRVGPFGLFDPTSSSVANTSTHGKHAIAIMAAGIRPSITGGCAALTMVASGSSKPDMVTLNFDAATEEYAQFSFPMPKKWNKGTITAKFYWSHAATTTNFSVVWSLQAVAVGDAEAIAASFGAAVAVTDVGGTTDYLYESAETSAITVAGTIGNEDTVFFRVFRKAADGSDTLAVDARLHGVVVYITTNADTDA